MKAFPCLLAIALAIAVTFPGCDAFPSGIPDGHGHDDIHVPAPDHKNWGGHDLDVNVVPVPLPRPIPEYQSWGGRDLDGLTGVPLPLPRPIPQFKNWGGYDLDVTDFPGSLSQPILNPRYGRHGGSDGKNILDDTLDDVGQSLSVPGNYGKSGIVAGLTLKDVYAKSILIQGTA